MAKVNMKTAPTSKEGGFLPALLAAKKLLPTVLSQAKKYGPAALSQAKKYGPGALSQAKKLAQSPTARSLAASYAPAAQRLATQHLARIAPVPLPFPLTVPGHPVYPAIPGHFPGYAAPPPVHYPPVYARGGANKHFAGIKTEFKGVPLSAIGGATQRAQQKVTPEQYEEMKSQAGKALEDAKAKAEYEHAKTLDAVKIEASQVPVPIVQTAVLPVVVGAADGDVFTSVFICIGILLLIYALYVLYQPSLTGKWIKGADAEKYVIIKHNRFTGNITVEYSPDVHARGVAVGLRRNRVHSGHVSGQSVTFIAGGISVNFGKWNYKNTIVTPGGTVYTRI